MALCDHPVKAVCSLCSLGTTEHGCTMSMSNEDGLAQLLSSYASDKSSSEDEQLEVIKYKTDQCDEIKTKDLKDGDNAGAREILPLPKGLLDMFKEDTEQEDDPCKHDGRIRSFSHFPGNWAMHIYIPFKVNVHFESLVASLVDNLSITLSCDVHMFPCDELHMSVSRTVPIRHYWIEPITEQLRNGLSSLKSFVSVLQFPGLYTNDEKTRSFIALKIMTENKKFQDIVNVVDRVFEQFSLPSFYKDPSFHVSVAWLLGDICSTERDKLQAQLQDVFDAQVCEKEIARSLVLEVREVHCKIGNKRFVFQLHSA